MFNPPPPRFSAMIVARIWLSFSVCAELTDWSGLLRSPGYDAGERYPSNYHDCWILGNDTMVGVFDRELSMMSNALTYDINQENYPYQ